MIFRTTWTGTSSDAYESLLIGVSGKLTMIVYHEQFTGRPMKESIAEQIYANVMCSK